MIKREIICKEGECIFVDYYPANIAIAPNPRNKSDCAVIDSFSAKHTIYELIEHGWYKITNAMGYYE